MFKTKKAADADLCSRRLSHIADQDQKEDKDRSSDARHFGQTSPAV